MTLLLGILTICSIVGSIAQDCIPPQPPMRDMPILITSYDPAQGGINCDDDCSNLSLVAMSPDLYGFAAACPKELVGLDLTAVIYHPDIGERVCLDRGSAVIVRYNQVVQLWVVHIDLLESSPHPLNYYLLWGWDYYWSDVQQYRG